MIYDFEKNVPEVPPETWVAPNASLIGKIKLEKIRVFGLMRYFEEILN